MIYVCIVKIPHKLVFVSWTLADYLALLTFRMVKLARQVAGMGKQGIH